MFERFTDRARQVVVLAQEESRRLTHNYIGTEHILLGLLHERDGLAARVLESFGLTLEDTRNLVARVVGAGEEVTAGQIPFTPRAKKVLELSLREALAIGHNYIGTEHILLGLTREDEGVAVRILLDFDVDSELIRREVIRMLSGAGERATDWTAGPRDPAVPRVGSSGRALPTASREYDDAPASELELGWRSRPVALAALGAAILERRAFDPSRTGGVEPLGMQVLVRLALGPPDGPLDRPGELVGSMEVGLGSDPAALDHALRVLIERGFVNCYDEQDDDQLIRITTAGLSALHAWLERAAALFGAWPPDTPGADDVTT